MRSAAPPATGAAPGISFQRHVPLVLRQSSAPRPRSAPSSGPCLFHWGRRQPPRALCDIINRRDLLWRSRRSGSGGPCRCPAVCQVQEKSGNFSQFEKIDVYKLKILCYTISCFIGDGPSLIADGPPFFRREPPFASVFSPVFASGPPGFPFFSMIHFFFCIFPLRGAFPPAVK